MKGAADQRPSILIDGAHHARELTSVSQVMYTMIRLLHKYLNNDSEVKRILSISGIFFVPIVNQDGYSVISNTYATDGYLSEIRKNQRNDIQCTIYDNIGVDLNRNYGYGWGADNSGSSSRPCEEDYRGEYAFSEPETQAIRDFVVSHPQLKIALNFHAWGNLFVIPFNYSEDRNDFELISKFAGAAAFYDDVWTQGGMPTNNVKG